MIKEYIWPSIKSMYGIKLSFIFIAIFSFSSLQIILFGKGIDGLIDGSHFYLIFLLFLLCKVLLFSTKSYCAKSKEKISGTIKYYLRSNLINVWIYSSQHWYDKQDPGEYKHLLCDQIDEMVNDILAFWEKTFEIIISILFALITISRIDWRVSVATIIYYPIAVYICILIGKGCLITHEKRQTSARSETGTLNSIFSGILEIIMLNKKEYFLKKASEKFNTSENASNQHFLQVFKFNLAETISKLIGYTIVFLISIYEYHLKNITLGSIIVQLTFAETIFLQLSQCNYLYDLYTSTKNYINILRSSLEAPRDYYGTTSLNLEKSHCISLKDVLFCYQNAPVITDMSITINAGEHIGLCGESGSGKTTLLKLISGMLVPTAGEICIDDYPLKELSRQTLANNIFLLLQQPYIFNATVFDNIVCGRQNIPTQAVLSALKVVGFSDCEISAFLYRPVGENGCHLSGGERKRIALARYFISPSPILLLDEPTAMLNSELANIVMGNIHKYCSSRTVIIVSHDKELSKWVKKTYYIKRRDHYDTKPAAVSSPISP